MEANTFVYVTFGQAHTHRLNNATFDCDCVARVRGDRTTVVKLFGRKWAFLYHTLNEVGLQYYSRGIIEAN
jgi:hypothetical protein